MKTYLIDDDIISNFITEKALSNEQFAEEIVPFLSAEEALESLLQDMPDQSPDVIFLDLNMPGMNGWGFLNALSPYKDELKDKCRIYILTSSLDTADTARSTEYELVHGLLHKPIDHQDIRTVKQELKQQNHNR